MNSLLICLYIDVYQKHVKKLVEEHVDITRNFISQIASRICLVQHLVCHCMLNVS